MTSARAATPRSRSTGRPVRRPVRRPARTVRRRPAGSTAVRTGARRRRRPDVKLGWWAVVLVVLAVVTGLAWQADAIPTPVPSLAPARCTVGTAGFTLSGEQSTNARTIAQVAADRHLPQRAVVIALATALQETHLRNLPYGDRDSLGLFQQRPSQGWGTPAQVQDPVYAAGKFFDHLVQVPGWQTGRLTDVSQAVQRSAFPLAYQQWGDEAQAIAEAIAAGTLRCG